MLWFEVLKKGAEITSLEKRKCGKHFIISSITSA